MIVPIFIDTASISEEFYLDQDQVNDLMDYTIKEITARFAEQWEQNAIKELSSSRQQYINSLMVVDEGFAKGAVVLVGELPNMIEQGVSSFDEKPGILKSDNAKTSKTGSKYATVPFNFGTPTALKENFSNIMPQEVYEIVKQRGTNEPLTTYDLKELPKEIKEPQTKRIQMPESKSFMEYQHKTSIYEGLTKKKDQTTGQNSYVSFRRVSDNSDPNAFIHPGIEARNIAQKTLDGFDIAPIVGKSIDIFLSQL